MEIIKDVIDIIKYISLYALSVIILLGFLFLIFLTSDNCYNGSLIYEYEDLDGNKGIANHCQFSDAKEYTRKGGQGQPICFVDKKIIAVKWYENKTNYVSCYKKFFNK